MTVSENKCAQAVAHLSDATLMFAYENIVSFRKTGRLDVPCTLSGINDIICKEMGWKTEHYKHTEQYVLMEIARRHYNSMLRKNIATIKSNDDVWIVENKKGVLHGTIYNVHKDVSGEVSSFTVSCDDGDFRSISYELVNQEVFFDEQVAMGVIQDFNSDEYVLNLNPLY